MDRSTARAEAGRVNSLAQTNKPVSPLLSRRLTANSLSAEKELGLEPTSASTDEIRRAAIPGSEPQSNSGEEIAQKI